MRLLGQLKFVFIILFLTGCQWFQPTAHFFISNTSEDKNSVDINVTIGGKSVLNNTIKYTNIRPDLEYTPYISLPKGKYIIKVVADSGRAIAEQAIDLGNDRWIFVSYSYAKPIDSSRAQILFKKFGLDTSFVNPKLRGSQSKVTIYVTDEEPVHM